MYVEQENEVFLQTSGRHFGISNSCDLQLQVTKKDQEDLAGGTEDYKKVRCHLSVLVLVYV